MKVIPGHTRYMATEDGRVWDTRREREVAQVITGEPPYTYVNVQTDEGERKLRRLHILIAKAYHPNPDNLPTVDHIDRDKFNNRKDNLRWATYAEQSVNRDICIFTEDGTPLGTLCEQYENPVAAYSYIVRYVKQLGVESAILKYDNFLRLGEGYRRVVEYDGQEVYLLDLCNGDEERYDTVIQRLRKGWPVWNALHGISAGPYHNSFTMPVDATEVVHVWLPSKAYLLELGISALDRKLEQYQYFCDVLADPYPGHLHTVQHPDGRTITGSLSQLCETFQVRRETVEARRKVHKMTLQEALLATPQRISGVYINGVKDSQRGWFKYFSLPVKSAISYRGRHKCTFEQVLQHYGVDLSTLEISY